MKVFKRPGSSFYAYKFQYRGKEYYRSTGTENRREPNRSRRRLGLACCAKPLDWRSPRSKEETPASPNREELLRPCANSKPHSTIGLGPPRQSRNARSSSTWRVIRDSSATVRGP